MGIYPSRIPHDFGFIPRKRLRVYTIVDFSFIRTFARKRLRVYTIVDFSFIRTFAPSF